MTCWFKRLISCVFILAVISVPRGGIVWASRDIQLVATMNKAKEPPEPKLASYRPASDALFMKYAPAMVKIAIKLHGVPVQVGAGFFISPEGHLLTNHHVVRNAVHSSRGSLEFIGHDNKPITKFELAGCSDQRLIDLCVFKLGTKPKTFFEFSDDKPESGSTVYAFGHPRGLDFALTRGTFTGLRTTAAGISEIDMKASLAPGNSGGPILTEQGKVIGIVTKAPPFLATKSDQKAEWAVGIAQNELTSFLAQHSKFLTLEKARPVVGEKLKRDAKRISSLEVEPAVQLAAKGLKVSDLKGFKDFTFDLDGQFVKVTLPSFLESCVRSTDQKTDQSAKSSHYACTGYGDVMAFTIQRFPAARVKRALEKMNQKQLVSAKLIDYALTLQHEGKWASLEKSLRPQARASFSSIPSAASCGQLRANPLPGAIFNGAWACRFTVLNDTEADSQSTNVWLEKGLNIFSFSVWVADPSLAPAFAQLPTLAALTARTDPSAIELVPRTVASDAKERAGGYEMDLPEAIGYIGPKADAASAISFDVYGKKKGIDRFDPGYTLAVTGRKAIVMPPEFENFSRNLLTLSARPLGFTVRGQTIDIQMEATRAAGKPTRILTAFGKSKAGREIVIYQATIYDSDRVFGLIQISSAQDPEASYREFKSLLSSFKLK